MEQGKYPLFFISLTHIPLSQDKLSFGYDLERIIDDWVLMGFLVGNDFLPHLPNMHIRQVMQHSIILLAR